MERKLINSNRCNSLIFCDIFGISSSILRREVEKWYRSVIEQHLWYVRDPTLRFIHRPPYLWDKKLLSKQPMMCYLTIGDQTGGTRGRRFYQYRYAGKKFHVKITYLTASDSKGDVLADIFLMSPTEYNTSKHCVWVSILRDNPTVADISDVNNYYQCTDHINQPPQVGRVYVRLMLKFLKTYASDFGINTVELADTSSYRCPDNRNISIPLEMSRQMEGCYPYYIQFGFRPKSRKNLAILKQNRQIMSTILTCDGNQIFNFFREIGCSQKISDYIASHQAQLMSETLKYISRTDCVFYGKICHILFEKFGLKELEKPIYVRNL